MKFDPRKPHGTITNHEWARYEQDGILFDGKGLPRLDQIISVKENPEPEKIELNISDKKDFPLDNAKAFLTNILSDGPLARSVIFNECTNNNQSWDAVKTVFADMGGETMKRRNVLYWKLRTQ